MRHPRESVVCKLLLLLPLLLHKAVSLGGLTAPHSFTPVLCCVVAYAVCVYAVKTLNTLTAVREAADVSLNSFFGLLLDNTKVGRSFFGGQPCGVTRSCPTLCLTLMLAPNMCDSLS